MRAAGFLPQPLGEDEVEAARIVKALNEDWDRLQAERKQARRAGRPDPAGKTPPCPARHVRVADPGAQEGRRLEEAAEEDQGRVRLLHRPARPDPQAAGGHAAAPAHSAAGPEHARAGLQPGQGEPRGEVAALSAVRGDRAWAAEGQSRVQPEAVEGATTPGRVVGGRGLAAGEEGDRDRARVNRAGRAHRLRHGAAPRRRPRHDLGPLGRRAPAGPPEQDADAGVGEGAPGAARRHRDDQGRRRGLPHDQGPGDSRRPGDGDQRGDGPPYKGDNFSHLFRDIADTAGFKTKQFIDLRRSSVVRLSLAGCTPQLISAITGHSIESVVRILRVYNPTTKEQSDLAITMLQAWRERQKLES